jgi:hypothetical protein
MTDADDRGTRFLVAHEGHGPGAIRSREVYMHGPAFDPMLTRRTAAREGAFFLPHLRAGMRVLDCGCGPGSITLGLAAAVSPPRNGDRPRGSEPLSGVGERIP